jgi:hypothetical protein
MMRAGSEHGPVAAPLHNRIRSRAGLKNPWIGNILPQTGRGHRVLLNCRGAKPDLAARAAGSRRDEVHGGRLPRIQPADV